MGAQKQRELAVCTREETDKKAEALQHKKSEESAAKQLEIVRKAHEKAASSDKELKPKIQGLCVGVGV